MTAESKHNGVAVRQRLWRRSQYIRRIDWIGYVGRIDVDVRLQIFLTSTRKGHWTDSMNLQAT